MTVIITSPSLDTKQNVSGISSVTQFIIDNNTFCKYIHFELGKKDNDRRNLVWGLGIIKTYFKWGHLMFVSGKALVHFNLPIDKLALLRDTPLILLARLLRKRLILHIHGGEFSTNRSSPIWMRCLLKLHFTGKNPKIILSTIDKQFITNVFNGKNLHVLPNCVDLHSAKDFKRETLQNEIPILLFMGRISLNKGIQYIYDALKILKYENHEFKFYLAGKGPVENEYVEKFTNLLGDNFIFKGVVAGDQKTALLKYCNVFLLPSFFEGLPMALLESMSFGLIPITTEVGSIKHLITNGTNGIIVNKHSSSDIVAAIKHLSTNKIHAQSISANAREHVFLNYNTDNYVQRLNKIYAYE